MCPGWHRPSECAYSPGPRPLTVGTAAGVAVGLRGSISVFLSGTSSAGQTRCVATFAFFSAPCSS